MTRPEDPIDDRTMPSPGDPWAAADQPAPTVNLGTPTTYVSGDATAYIGNPAAPPEDATTALGGPTVYQGGGAGHLGGATPQPGQPTAHLGDATAHPGQPTAYLGGTTPQPGQPAAHFGGLSAQPSQPTAHLGGATAQPGQPTMHLGGATPHPGQPTVHHGQPGQPTVHLGGATAYFGQPSGHLDDPGRTVSLGSADGTVHLSAANPVSPATVHAPPPAPTVHPDGSTPTVRHHDELRFGPGVPPAPVVTPAWPGGATAKRPRPLWRRLVSLVSSLLTLALVGVVGFYIWQRLSPLVVEGVTVAVPQPAGNRCDVTVDVVATVRTNGRSGVIRYQWFRSDAPPGAVLTEQVGSGQRSAALTLKWTFSGTGTATETATVNIIEPSPVQVGTQVNYRCQS